MGKLIRLELFNFKSYKGHHVLLFGDAYFTSIIGPNGSGKSNSMDAISFVLGIKSSHLRSSQLKDLIYRGRILKTSKINADGTATAVVENGQPNGEANGVHQDDRATASDDDTNVRSSQRNDPKTAWVMAVYLDDSNEEQKWKRTITSSGSSEYRINNRVVSQKEYNEALEAENILIKARNFLVFQGDVEQIASQAPRDLTRLIEQISGSLEYKAEYEQLKQEVVDREKEAKFKYEQRRSVNAEVKQCQDQKAEADSYNRKLEERDDAVIMHTLWRLYHLQRNIDEASAEIQKHQEELMEHQRKVQQFENALESARREQAKAAQDVSKSEKMIKRREREVEEKQISLDPIEIKIQNLRNKVKGYQDRINGVKKERNSQQENVEKLKKELVTVQKAQKKSEDDAKAIAQQEGRELSEADLKEYEQLKIQVASRASNAQIKIDDLSRQIKTTEDTLNTLKNKVDACESAVQRLEEEDAAIREQKQSRTAEVKDLKDKVDAKKKDLNAKLSEKSRVENKRQEHNEKIQDLYMKLSEAEGGRRRSEKEQKDRDNLRSLKSTFGDDRVFGRISDLCKPKEKRFEFAVETALGHHLDSIVVDTEKTATECIENMNALKKGIITCIPLDTAQIKPIDPNLKGIHPKSRLLLDSIDYDNRFERAMSFACSSTLVCDDLSVARKVVYDKRVHVKAVTLDGSIIHKGGNMTGGRGPEEGRNKRRWESEDVDGMQRLLDKLRDELRKMPSLHTLREDEEKLRTELSRLEMQRQFAEEQLKGLNRNIESKKKELDNAKSQLKENRPAYQRQQQQLEAFRGQLNEMLGSMAEVEDQVFADFCRRLNYDNIRTYEAQQGSMQQQLNEKRQQYETHRTRLQSQLKFETDRLERTRERIKKLEESAKKDQQDLAAMEVEKVKFENDLDDMRAELEAHKEQLEQLKDIEAEKKEKVSQERAEFQKRSKKLDASKTAINNIEQEKRKHAVNRYTLLRQCKIEKTEIPLMADSEPLDSLPLDDILQEDPEAMDVDDPDVTTLPMKEARDYGIVIDFDKLDEDLQKDDSDNCEEKLRDRIASLSSELEKMNPQSRAEERLETVKRRQLAADQEHQTASRDLQRVKRAFENVQEMRLELFNKAFNHISEQIVGVYKELTRSASFPLGGTAHLTVENDEEPYLEGVRYHAMPPLKRFRDMEHLSGGEKTIAALALLFAVHSFQPSPFFVLDEVDAALDNVNVSRVANYVKEHARPGMQFIVISLKTGLFQESESLVGVMRDQGENSSKVITLDLRKYKDN